MTSSPAVRLEMPRVRAGLIGVGAIASYFHLRLLHRMRGVTLVAASDPSPEARTRAGRFRRVSVYERFEDLLARPDIDAVIICAPSHLHATLAVAAASAGKHVYLEKPIATTLEDARRVVDAVEAAGIIGVVGFNRRVHPLFEQARTLLAAGRLGRVRAVHCAFCEPPPPTGIPEWKRQRSTGGGVLLDLASHHIDLLRWLLECDVLDVTASISSDRIEHDGAQLSMTLRGGIDVHGFYSFRSGLTDHLEFIGEQGTLRVDRHRAALELMLRRRLRYGLRRVWVGPTLPTMAWRVYRAIRPGREPSYRRALCAFRDLLRGKPNRLASLTDGIHSLATILAAERSASMGGARCEVHG